MTTTSINVIGAGLAGSEAASGRSPNVASRFDFMK